MRRPLAGRHPARLTPWITAPAVAVALLLSGCSSAVNAQSTGGGTGTANAGPLTVAVALDAQPKNVLQNLGRNNPWVGNVFQTLLTRDSSGKLVGVLASKWTFAPDGKSVDITLRSGVTWQNGDPFTADDVKYTFETIQNPKTQTNQHYVDFATLTVTSPTTLHGTFAAPSQAQATDAFLRDPIVHKGTYTPNDNGSTIVGTGPYEFKNWQPGSGYTLAAYSGYWGTKPSVKTINFIATTDATGEINALKGGRAQAAWGLSIANSQTLTSTSQWKGFNDGGTIFDLSANVNKAPFTDARVRQALGYAIDYNRINQQVFGGKATVSDVYWDASTPGLDSSYLHYYSYNPTKAKQLVQAAGATGATFTIAVGPNPTLKAVYQIVANNLKAIGLNATIKSLDNSGFQAGLAKGDLGPAFLHFTGKAGLSPQSMLAAIPQLHQGNAEGFFPAQYVQLRQAFLSATTPQAQQDGLNALTKYLLENAPTFPIVHAPDVVAVKSTVSGLSTDALGHILYDGVTVGG